MADVHRQFKASPAASSAESAARTRGHTDRCTYCLQFPVAAQGDNSFERTVTPRGTGRIIPQELSFAPPRTFRIATKLSDKTTRSRLSREVGLDPLEEPAAPHARWQCEKSSVGGSQSRKCTPICVRPCPCPLTPRTGRCRGTGLELPVHIRQGSCTRNYVRY